MAFLWIRNEVKPLERRTNFLPKCADMLIGMGHDIVVESSKLRIIPDIEYAKVGCRLVEPGTWLDAEAKYYILGLKNLPDEPNLLKHKHIYYAHCYKGQTGATQLLTRFKNGGGELFDCEYLTDKNGKSIIVSEISELTGYIGAAIAIQTYVQKKLQKTMIVKPYYEDKEQMLQYTLNMLKNLEINPSIIILGHKGNTGRGAKKFFEDINMFINCWGREETSCVSKLSTLNQFEIIINCTKSSNKEKPFLVEKDLYADKKISILMDVTCDAGGETNKFPFYHRTTTFDEPFLRIGPNDKPVDIIAIDHLTNCLPLEASHALANPFFTYLKELLNSNQTDLPNAWLKTKNEFYRHING
ncbi:MAG: hypothetical protein P1U74_04625 [Legionellaceae bacterium]|nr:hypothetical protein [Legionellaceae bacterium]